MDSFVLLEALLTVATLLPRTESAALDLRARSAPLAAALAPTSPLTGSTTFDPTARAVSNWRGETGRDIAPPTLAFVVRYAERDPAFVARCVRLNNYWCIKRASWSGEIGGDDEGHTAFATAEDGAAAAASLLRRYYRDLGRRTALGIVRRWAPAACGSPPAFTPSAATPVANALAPRGIGRTLRARYLARHARGGSPRIRGAARGGVPGGLRVQAWSARARLAGRPGRAIPGLAAPRAIADISGGVAAGDVVPSTAPAMPSTRRDASGRSMRTLSASARDPASLLAPERLAAEAAALPPIAAGLPAAAFLDLRVPAPLCGGDEPRIRNYADAIARSVGVGREDDLGLFDPVGTATARLAPVMEAMSRVELGALRASHELVERAINRLASGSIPRTE